jgi:hypothetical protein
VDFMSQMRMVKMNNYKNFVEAVNMLFGSTKTVCEHQELHFIFDSYLNFSIKESERIRREGFTGRLELSCINNDTPIPVQLDKFWQSSANKVKLQQLAKQEARKLSIDKTIVVSGMISINDDDDIMPAYLYEQLTTKESEIDSLASSIEEADCHIVPHIEYTILQNTKRVVVLSNDTDIVLLILRYIYYFQSKGLDELWIRFGTGQKRRLIPIHELAKKLGPHLCSVYIKAYIATGNDALSKIGTKHAAIIAKPENFLIDFGESTILSEIDMINMEKYLVKKYGQ